MPKEPERPKSSTAIEKLSFAFAYSSWESKHSAWRDEFNKISSANENLIRKHNRDWSVSAWDNYDEELKLYFHKKSQWEAEISKIEKDSTDRYEAATKLWRSEKADFDVNKAKAILFLINLEKSGCAGNVSDLSKFLLIALRQAPYPRSIAPNFSIQCDITSKIVLIDCHVVSFSQFHIKRSDGKNRAVAVRTLKKLYDTYIYGVILRSVFHLANLRVKKLFDTIAVNVKTTFKHPATGLDAVSNLASLMVSTHELKEIDIQHVEPEAFFRRNSGVAASSLAENVEVPPILTFNTKDNRFIDGRNIVSSKDQNIAEMDWEDFEHLVRQLFELHFAGKNAEVRVTRSSRDRGVDAVIFDPDPISGGKIVIQAKRYTNTVEVAAVRELFGTTQNEGANKGILVTTSNYGPDSHEFARGKNITLINGAQFLGLLRAHGFSYSLDIEQARKNLTRNR